MSDLDNSNLTNEEDNSGFSPSEPDNNSFSADKGSAAPNTANGDWGQPNFTQKPTRKMPIWPFLLVGAFVLVGLFLISTVATNMFPRNEAEELAKNGPKITVNTKYHTKHIPMNKHYVVETKKSNIQSSGHHNPENMPKCNPQDCKPGGKCDPNDCKPGGKCDPNDCKPGGKCDPKDCEPGGKCDPNDCKPHGKYDPISGKPIHHRSKCHTSKVMNCEETSIQTVTPKPLRKRIYPKEGKPTLQDNAKGLYVLQVYSALSKEDADAKYEEFKSKGAEKVWVSTYTNSNVVWYRVRIGDFSTKAAADAKARELGISTYWVDKIR